MKQLTNFFGDAIVGVTNGFDRIVFQGMIRPLMYAEGAMGFFRRRRILFKDAKEWVIEQTERMNSAVEEWSLRECGERITFLPSSKTRKERLARERQQEKGITIGPVGTWSCLEAGGTYRLVPAEGAPQLRYTETRCKHLYLYLDHQDYGFMSIRMQTWFPYRIQIAMNGREWFSTTHPSQTRRPLHALTPPFPAGCLVSSSRLVLALSDWGTRSSRSMILMPCSRCSTSS